MASTGASKRAATPAHDQRCSTAAAGRVPKLFVVGGGQGEDRLELAAEVDGVAALEGDEMPEPLGQLLLDARRHLGEPGVARDERRRARGGGLGGDHPERLGEDRRHDRHVGQRQQMHEMAVLERPGEERPRRGQRLELGPVRAEADHDEARVDRLHRLQQHLHALLLDQLPEVDDGRLVAGEELREPGRVALVGQALARVAGVRTVAARLLEQRGERLVARLEAELVDVDARRHLEHAVDVADDVLEHLADVHRADEGRLCLGERRPPPLLELRTAAHRVLELGAVRLHAEPLAGGGADRAAHQHVVREDQIGREQLAERCRVRVDVGAALGRGEVLQQARLETGVAVEHEDGQQPARQVGDDDLRAAEVEVLGRALLADDHHLVPGARPFERERARVDVRPGAAEEIPVPEQQAHRGGL